MTPGESQDQEEFQKSDLLRRAEHILAGHAADASEDLFRWCLALVVRTTGSSFGFIGKVDASGRLRRLAVSDTALIEWQGRELTAFDQTKHAVAENGFYARVLSTRESVCANDLSRWLGSGALPAGHPAIDTFLAVPLLHERDVVGVLAIANKTSGYDRDDVARVESLAPTLANAVLNYAERKRTEDALIVLSRIHAVLSKVNEVIVRERDERTLLRRICQIVADEGHYGLVWIGFVRDTAVLPVAWSHDGAEYVQGIRIEVTGAFGAGPTGSCIREQRRVVNDDFANNPATHLWQKDALQQGFRSSAAFPLQRGGKVVGAITLYATRTEAFDRDHVHLLESLCDDISYALDAFDQEHRRIEAEQALRASEQALREADRRKNAFLAVLSHELRNPLAPLHTALHILEQVPGGSGQAKNAIATIARQSRQITRLVDDLLEVTRITRNKLRLQRASFDISQLVARIAEDHRVRFSDAGLTLDITLSATPLWLDGDEQRIAQVVSNLLTNAMKFTPRGGSVSIALEFEQFTGRAILRVTDTGVGISAEMLPRLFDAFVQADDSLDRSQSGLGLGLAIAKAVIQMHGGDIHVDSQGLGRGAEFVVQLPFAQTERIVKAASMSSRPPPPRRVLVIDDNEDAAESLREALELNSHKVDTAYDGREGLVRAREFNPDVVLCDIGLPGMSGFDVARAFRNDHVLRSTYLVAVTGYARAQDREQAEQAGFDFHLPKPVRMDDIQRLFASFRNPIEREGRCDEAGTSASTQDESAEFEV